MTALARERRVLPEKQIESLRRMVGWRPEWAEEEPGGRLGIPRGERDPQVVGREARMRAWFAAEGIDPLGPLPRGARKRAMAALGIESAAAFTWSMRNIRNTTGRADRRAS